MERGKIGSRRRQDALHGKLRHRKSDK